MEKQALVHDIVQDSQFKAIKVTKTQTVAELLKELNLEDAFLAVLVDGVKAELTDEINENQKIIILPKIAGG
ncbi:MAG TPA: MoaD/ThiS family protein [Candidatus Lokiarchaeia archaeon]|nr:MoaD/ThiS family protein [Candidatus Lokiarchaeia archaeon]